MAKLKNIIGIEMDSGHIRGVELQKTGDGYSVNSFAKVPLDAGVIDEGFIRDSDKFSDALSQLLSEGGFRAGDVIVGVNNENVIMRFASFPKVSDDKLQKMVLLQAQEFIPIPIAEMEVDYVVTGEGVNDDDMPVLNVLLVAARRSMLESIITLFNATKLNVRDIDSSVLAWCRAAINYTHDETIGVIKLSDDVLNFLAIEKGEIKVVRSLNVPDRYAPQIRRLFNEPATCTEEDYASVAGLLNTELSSSISYYQMQGFSPIESIYFSALCESEKELMLRLRELSFIPVTIPDFCSEYETSEFAAAEYIGCISLALAALEG